MSCSPVIHRWTRHCEVFFGLLKYSAGQWTVHQACGVSVDQWSVLQANELFCRPVLGSSLQASQGRLAASGQLAWIPPVYCTQQKNTTNTLILYTKLCHTLVHLHFTFGYFFALVRNTLQPIFGWKELKKIGPCCAMSWTFERMFTPHNKSHVTCDVSHVTCHMSRVTCHVSRVTFFYFFIFGGGDKVLKLIGGGSVINAAYPV